MALLQLIYASQPFGFDDLAIEGILASAARNNRRDAITGALICREDLYLQLLEGPADAVRATFDRIARDDRHVNVVRHCEDEITDRLFPTWAMRHDPAQSWIWTREEVSSGILEGVTADAMRAVFARISKQEPETLMSCPFRAA